LPDSDLRRRCARSRAHISGKPVQLCTQLLCPLEHRWYGARNVQFAFVFPGQGSQYVGMGQALAAESAAAAETFNSADVVLDEPLSRLMFEGPAEQLDQTINSQPAILTHSVALLRALEELF